MRKLKLVEPRASANVSELRLAGVEPTQDMVPAEYLAKCEGAWLEPVGKGLRAVLQFVCVDGKHDGVALRQWLPIAEANVGVSPASRYARHCAIALGRPLTRDDQLGDPAAIFGGHTFVVFVGYRKTEKPKGGMASDQNAYRKKDDFDYLRVHEIRSCEDL